MELDLRNTFVDLEHDATIASDRLSNFHYVSKGGFALVFVANYRRNDGLVQPVAVKVLKPENHFRPANYSKFLQEVAFQTALKHQSIVRALGFCSVPVFPLIAAAPPGILIPEGGGSGPKGALSAEEWFAKRRLWKCWALVMELMPDGNMFDQVLAAARGATSASINRQPRAAAAAPTAATTAAAGGGGGPGGWPAVGPGSYSDAQGLLWLIDVADAMTYLHSRQPLLIHRDLKLENILLRREGDGLVRAKLSDFGLTAAINAAGRKVPPPQVLRAPGQSLEDVRASAPTVTAGVGVDTPSLERPCCPAPAVAATAIAAADASEAAGCRTQTAAASNVQASRRQLSDVPVPVLSPTLNPQGPWELQQQQQQKKQQLLADRKVASSSQVLGQATGARELSGHVQCATAAAAAGSRQGGAAYAAPNTLSPNQGQGQNMLGVGQIKRRPWSAVDVQEQLLPKLEVQETGSAADKLEGGRQRGMQPALEKHQAMTTQQPLLLLPPRQLLLLHRRSSHSWTGVQQRSGGDAVGSAHHGPSCIVGPAQHTVGVGPHGLQSEAALQAGVDPLMPSICRASSSRRSETGHMQVKMEQVNELMLLGMGHEDYMPDMYQMAFRLTTQCGSVCYMPPEVARQQPYNQKADAFSFGCIMFEVMTRQLLSDSIRDGDLDAAMEYLSRVSWSGWRPDFPTWLCKELRLLISLCWHREPRLRPSFPTIATRLREVLLVRAMGPLQTKPSLVATPPLASQRSHQQPLQSQMQLLQQQQQQWAQQQFILQQQLLLQVQQQQQKQVRAYLIDQEASKHMSVVNALGSAVSTATMQSPFQLAAPPCGGDRATAATDVDGTAAATQSQTKAHQQQQLQSQLQQLNACARPAGASASAAASVMVYSHPPQRRVHNVSSRRLSQIENKTTCTTTGCRMSSPVLGRDGAASTEAAVALPPGRATAGAVMATRPQNSDGSYFSALPSPVSLSGSRAGLGSALGAGPSRGSRGTVSRSEGSTGVVSGSSSFRTPRGQQQWQPEQRQPEQLDKATRGQEGCVSLCTVM